MKTFRAHPCPRNSRKRFGRTRPFDFPHLLTAAIFFLLMAVAAMMILGRSLARAQASSPAQKTDTASAGNAENGKRLFTSLGCYKCHGNEGQGIPISEREDAGPRIRPTKRSLPRFLKFVRDPTGEMQPYTTQDVSDAELSDVYAYLQSGTAPPEPTAPAPANVQNEQQPVAAPQQTATSAANANAQNGQRLYTSYGCYECHGGEGQGSIQTAGSRIGPPRIDFSEFATYIRQPKGQMPPYSVKAVPDAELADIYAFLQTRPEPPPAKNIPLLNQ
jgi:cytochrome c5